MVNVTLVEVNPSGWQLLLMSSIRRSILLPVCVLLALGTASCESANRKPAVQPIVQVVPSKADGWLRVASPRDVERIRRVSSAWQQALADVRASGRSGELRSEGDLLKPLAALDRPAPTPGSYNCRQIKLGRLDRRTPTIEKFKPFFCYVEVEGELLTIVKQTGSERPAGRLWEDDDVKRLIFLGTLALGNEGRVKAYGDDPRRDMAGIVERVGPFQWRLVLPWPRGTSKLDVIELTPVAEQPK